MARKANINWTVKQLVKMMDKGTAHFDNALQRGRRAACSSCRLHQCSISQGQGGCCHRNIF